MNKQPRETAHLLTLADQKRQALEYRGSRQRNNEWIDV